MPYLVGGIDWSSKIAAARDVASKHTGDALQIATAARDAASKHTGDALQIAAKKIEQLAEHFHDTDDNASAAQTLCQLVDGNGTCQDYSLQQFFDAVGTTKQTPYLIVSIMGSQNGGKSTMLNYMVSQHSWLHTVLSPAVYA